MFPGEKSPGLIEASGLPAVPQVEKPDNVNDADAAPIWVGIVNGEYGWIDTYVQSNLNGSVIDMDVFVDTEKYCDTTPIIRGKRIELSCGMLERRVADVQDVYIVTLVSLPDDSSVRIRGYFQCHRQDRDAGIYACWFESVLP